MKTIVFTIIARNYLAHASLLMESLHKHNPDWELQVFFIDDLKADVDFATSSNVQEIFLPRKKELSLKYSILEYSTAVKPWVFAHLFKLGYSKVMYFDPDIYVYQSLSELETLLDEYDGVLTPHITMPYKDDAMPGVKDFLQVGIYNLGFVALKNSEQTNDFTKWWGTQLLDYGFSKPEEHQFTDQKWMDFAPSFLNIRIMRSDGYNIAYWNLHEYIDKNKSVYFIHYSGFSNNSKLISKYQNRYYTSNIGEFSQYFTDYFNLLSEKKSELSSYYIDYKYPFDYFEGSEIKIGSSVRMIYDHLLKHNHATADEMNSKELLVFLLKSGEGTIPNLLYYLYQVNSDIKQWGIVPNWRNGFETRSYIRWFFRHGFAECDIDRNLVIKIAQQMNLHSKIPSSWFNPIEIIFLPIEQFLSAAYKRLLFRNIDTEGLDANIRDYEQRKSNKFTLLFKIIRSNEYKEKNEIGGFYYLSLFLYSLLGAPPYLISTLFQSRKQQLNRMPQSKNSDFGINIAGYFTTESGVADSARGVLSALDSGSIATNVVNIEQPYLRSNNKSLVSRFSKNHNYFANLICVNADQTPIVLHNSLPKSFLKQKYNIGYWYWEGNIFPHEYLESFSDLDEIWVATSYIQEIVSQVSPIPVIKIPPSFSLQKASKFNFALHEIDIPQDAVLALQLFDSASFVERKNPLATFKAFEMAVRKNPKLHLLMKTTNIKDNAPVHQQFIEFQSKTPNVHLLDGYLAHDEIESLIQSCNIYISLHRSEGLGIPLIKAMLAGIPTIATDFGGNRDFMTSTNSYPVGHKPFILNEDIGPYKQGTLWAEADYEQASKFLLDISKNPISTNSHSIADLFSSERVSKLIAERLISVY